MPHWSIFVLAAIHLIIAIVLWLKTYDFDRQIKRYSNHIVDQYGATGRIRRDIIDMKSNMRSMHTTLKESAPYTAPQQSIPDQLYYFKEIDSSLDDAFSDVTGDRLYMTESGVVTMDAFEKANEKYLARYTAPGKVLKYEWTYLGNGIHGLVRDKRFRAQCIHGKDFRFHYKDVSSIKYPEMLDAMFAAEYYYDNYIKH